MVGLHSLRLWINLKTLMKKATKSEFNRNEYGNKIFEFPGGPVKERYCQMIVLNTRLGEVAKKWRPTVTF